VIAPRTVAGFTLLELLVAVAIFSVVGVLALSGYTQLQKQSEYAAQRLDRTRQVQRAVQTLAQDLEQVEPRPIREPIGEALLPSLMLGVTTEYRLQLTRAGWSNTAGLPRPTVQRVGYRVENQELWRDHWPVLDRTLGVEPVRERMLTGVRSITFRVLDGSRTWVDQWPEPQAIDPAEARRRPAAVEITIELDDWGTIRRLVEVPG
jgi:general secretion pathway protein J